MDKNENGYSWKRNLVQTEYFLGSFKKCFFKLCLKVLRLSVHLSVSRVLFQKVGPMQDKANWLLLVLRKGHFNFWKLPLNWTLRSLATLKTSLRYLGHSSLKYLKPHCLTYCLNLQVTGNQFKCSNSSWDICLVYLTAGKNAYTCFE